MEESLDLKKLSEAFDLKELFVDTLEVICAQCESQNPNTKEIIIKISEFIKKINVYGKNGEYSKQIRKLDDLIEKLGKIDKIRKEEVYFGYLRASKTIEIIYDSITN